jgi:hypothetical protein
MGGLKFVFPPQTPEQDSESLETILEVLGSAAASETVNKYIDNITSKISIKLLRYPPPSPTLCSGFFQQVPLG